MVAQVGFAEEVVGSAIIVCGVSRVGVDVFIIGSGISIGIYIDASR